MRRHFTQNYLWVFMLIMCYEVACVANEKSDPTSEEMQVTIEDGIPICSTNRLTVKGYNVKISHVLNASCFGKVKSIDVFALNSLYFDADFNAIGQQVQLSLIAPVWVIIGNRKIILNGQDGDEHALPYAPNGIGSFKHGRPGRPGVSAGHLLGIADIVKMDESKLEIHMNGGRGGPGQHGGRGNNGVDGEDPPIPANSDVAFSLWKSLGFVFSEPQVQNVTSDEAGFRFEYVSTRVFGRNPTVPGDGGHGGVGGIGGYAGTHFIVGLNDQPIFSIFAERGDNGNGGEGSACGVESRSGLPLDFVFRNNYSLATGRILEYGPSAPLANCASKSVGVDGTDDYYDVGIEHPDAVHRIDSRVINTYKSFVRRTAAVHGENISTNFVEKIDKNERIQSLYDTLGLVDEMLDIETQYFELKDKNHLTSYLNSVLKRTEKLAKNFKESTENKSVLRWLYTTIKMRLSTVATNTAIIVDLPEYLNELEAQILKFRRNEIEVNVNDHQYALNNEIRSVEAFIKNRILPELENTIAEISSNVSTLVVQLYERQYKFTPDTDPCSTENDTMHLQHMMMTRDKMFPFEALNTMFSSMDIERSIMIGNENENEATGEWMSGSYDFSLDFEPSLDIGKHSEKHQLFIEQLNDIERELNQLFSVSESNSLSNITRNVAELKSDLTEQLQKGVLESNGVDSKRDELISLFEEEQSELQFGEDLDVILAILNLRTVPIDFYKQLSVEGITRMLNYHEMTNRMEEEAAMANLKIEYIYDTILKQFLNMEKSVKEISRQLINKSHFELEASKWQTIGTIRDLKAFYLKLGNDTSVIQLLCRTIEKLEDTTIFLFEAYDYVDHLKKANSVNGLSNAAKKLEKVIQMNIIAEKYDLAVRAFELQQFPFANKILMSDLKLPKDLQPDDNDKLAKVIIDRCYYLKDKVKSLGALIGKYDRFVLSNIDFSTTDRSLIGPFHSWKFSNKTSEERSKLLRGEEIRITANINDKKTLNAVKFNEIGIKFKIGGSNQAKLDSDLDKCIVTMTMIGTSDYRCDEKIHSFAVDDNVSFTFSFKRNSDGQPIISNDVYQKIEGKHYFLSPYTTWKIKIEHLDDVNLKRFEKHEFDLELIGRGQYVKNSNALSQACSELN